MSEVIVGYVKAARTNKFGYFDFCVTTEEGDVWVQSGGKATICAKGDDVEVTVEETDYGLKMVRNGLKKVGRVSNDRPKARALSAGGGEASGGKRPYVDNTIGMGVGAAVNNAVALYNNGKITEAQLPSAVANLYKLSEYAKKLATDGELDKLHEISTFTFTGEPKGKAETAASKAAPKKTTRKAAEPEPEEDEEEQEPPKRTVRRTRKAAPPPVEEPEQEEEFQDDDIDDIPF